MRMLERVEYRGHIIEFGTPSETSILCTMHQPLLNGSFLSYSWYLPTKSIFERDIDRFKRIIDRRIYNRTLVIDAILHAISEIEDENRRKT